jgi:hypothetical protein
MQSYFLHERIKHSRGNLPFIGGSMSITSKTQGEKLQHEISLAQRIEPGRRMRWSDVDILFRLEDHPDTELLDKNMSFIKISIGRHKVAKTLINSGALLNLMMRKTFIEMGLNLAELTLVHDTFHGIITGQSSTPIGRIDLEVFCGAGENKCREMLTFEVVSFNIRYNCIMGMPLFLKFMATIHTFYATIKMSGPKGIIILKSDQRDALACENVALTHAMRFGEKEAQELATSGQGSRRKHSGQNNGSQTTSCWYTPATYREEEHIRELYIKPAHHRSAGG